MNQNYYTLYFDGSCGPKNPGGTAAYGFVLKHDGQIVKQGNGVIGSGPEMSNNLAEFAALYEGLAEFSGYKSINFPFEKATLNCRGDSDLVIQIMSGKWKAKKGLYYNNYIMADGITRHLRKHYVNIFFEYIPRESNDLCDSLSKLHRQK